VKPATSGPAADLAAAPTSMALDWFYLGLYPLMYAWSPGALWALAGAATLLLVALPWLPPRKGTRAEHHVMVRPDNRIVATRDADTLLDALLREEIPIGYECRSGGCGECKCTVLLGTVEQGPHQPTALSAAERDAGLVLACTASARSDIEIEYVPRASAVEQPRLYTARVARMERLAADVMLVLLAVEGGARPAFRAGQYLNIVLDDGTHRSFSFATAPHVPGDIELHIRRVPGGAFTTHVFERMQPGDVVRFEAPLGSFVLREHPDKPIIFVAGATGFAPVKSMIEDAFQRGVQRPLHLYWGVRTRRDLYLASLAQRWAREHPNFHFVPVLSAALPEDEWTGRTGLVHEAILEDFPDLAGHEVYACGSVQMVQAVHPAFARHGLAEEDCFSDAFHLRPHAARQLEPAEMVRLGGT
jgi:NAD(P)H-flavin reductase/ferredoxin